MSVLYSPRSVTELWSLKEKAMYCDMARLEALPSITIENILPHRQTKSPVENEKDHQGKAFQCFIQVDRCVPNAMSDRKLFVKGEM